jgi:hypothetical protein
LDKSHDTISCGAHVIGRDLADGGIEGSRSRANSEEERHFDEEDDERGDTIGAWSVFCLLETKEQLCGLQAYDTKDDKKRVNQVEQVGDTKCEA